MHFYTKRKTKEMRKIKFRFWDVTLKKMCFRKPLTYDFVVDQVMHFIWMWIVVNYCC